MARNIQEYINNLVNKNKTFYLSLDNQSPKIENHKCQKCNEKLEGKTYCQSQNCNPKQLDGEITDLKEFANIKGISVSNNQLTSLNFLNTLPNKDKLKGINLFGNQIKEVDFAELFTKFPKLEKINLASNPISAKNLNNLTNEQFSKLIDGIKGGKIAINSFKGTILMDLLAYAQQLANQGNNQQQQNAHYLQTLISGNSPAKSDDKQPNNNNNGSLLIGGLVIFGILAVGIGYL
jgi:hypothetical protein